MKNYSLRTRLIAWISIPIIFATLAALASSYHFAKEEIEEVYDAQLVHSAKVLLQLTEHEILEEEGFDLGLENPDLQHKYERNLGFRIWANNVLVTESPTAQSFKDFEAPPGFSNHIIDGHEWRFFVFLEGEKGIKIEVSERNDIRYELIVQLMISLIVPALMFLPVLILIIWIGVSKVLNPVVKMAADVDQRGSDDLSPMKIEAMPEEILPFAEALNRLFARLEESFKREREFTDHAAHELRTPLAAMKTQTQVLIKKVGDKPDCAEGLANLQASIDRAAHLVDQLLSLARLQNESLPLDRMNLSACVSEAVRDFESSAKAKEITLSGDITPNIYAQAHEASLPILLANLLDNAIKYTSRGGSVTVSLNAEGLLSIADTGTGLSDTNKKRVFERFVRVDKTGQSGSGLGLSIVQWIASAHKAKITLEDNAPHGLKVLMQWKVMK